MKYIAIVLSLLALLAGSSASAFKRTEEGQALKDFTLPTADGAEVTLSRSLGRKATLLLFWAGWSPRSTEALSEFQELYQAYGPEDLQVIAVDVEDQTVADGDLERLVAVTRELEVNFPVVFDRSLEVFDEYGVIAVPSTVLADEKGTVVGLLEGYSNMTRNDFKERVLEVLGALQPRTETSAEAAGYVPKGKAARYFHMGDMLGQRGLQRKAEQALRRALQEDPEYADAYRRLAEVLEEQGRDEEAVAARNRYRELVAQPPGEAAPTGAAGVAETASAEYQPDPAAVRFVRMGSLFLTGGKAVEAEAAFRKSTARDPRFAEAFWKLAEALEAQGKRAEAQQARERAGQLDGRPAGSDRGKEKLQ